MNEAIPFLDYSNKNKQVYDRIRSLQPFLDHYCKMIFKYLSNLSECRK